MRAFILTTNYKHGSEPESEETNDLLKQLFNKI